MRILIVGLGEVGSALYEIAIECGKFEVFGYDIDYTQSKHKLDEIPRPLDYQHIAIPFKGYDFVDTVRMYIEIFSPRMVFIHSTVAPGTSRKVYERCGVPVVYTPIRGKHPKLKRHILFWPKWIAVIPNNDELITEAKSHLESMGLKVKVCSTPESLELAKLWETVYRAIMIVSWQEIHRIAKRFNAELSIITEFVAEVHQVLRDRPVYFPGYIGGHCLIPNTKILNEVYPSKLFQFVLESNDLRAKELEDPSMRKEVEELKKLFLELSNKEYYGGAEI